MLLFHCLKKSALRRFFKKSVRHLHPREVRFYPSARQPSYLSELRDNMLGSHRKNFGYRLKHLM